VALYGGAFDPIHNGHLATIAALLASAQVDKVVVVPSGDRPDKKVNVRAVDRLEMVRSAVDEAFGTDPRIEVSDVHALAKVGYGTIDLVDHFSKDTNLEIFVVIGHELLSDLPSWKESSRLCAQARFLVAQRPGSSLSSLPKGVNATLLNAPYQAGVVVSSTTLRTLLAAGLSCAGLLPPSVVALCRDRGFYSKAS
jgi:nicotinate-nucleotide adenylyltransferase